jgi:dolichol-phosphate mannosyltransferase
MITSSIVIPIFNEEDNINNLFNEIVDSGVYNKITDIIFINDSSNDNSNHIIEKIKSKNSKVLCISHKKNLGQSSCLKTAAFYSKNECLITIDGDCQNNPNDINKLLQIYSSKKYQLVGGIRHKRRDSFIKIISSKIANKIRIFILKDDCVDTGCSLKIFNRELFLKLPFFDGIHRFLPALFKAYGAQTFFVNVDHRFRKYGISKYDTFGRLIRGIRDIYRVLIIIKRFKKKNV